MEQDSDSAEAAHKARLAVECGINRLGHHWGVASRYDQLAVRFEGTDLIVVINKLL
ncbi:hypothetical protein [Actinomadura terrae]|uniref:hypothetical protein n=1 Tax=Actinomadura terrae TaxID=604353 RepID=UPI001FA6D1C4|nr:hypothetical protein [Actinomadura terrae]